MKNKIRYFIIILFIIVFSGSESVGQVQNYLEKLESLRIAFFTERLDLTPDEAEKFWPVYKDYNNRREKINEDRRMIYRNAIRNDHSLTEDEIRESLEKFINLQKEETALSEMFNQKFLEILPPRKVLRIYITENQFKAFILNEIKENRHESPVQRRRTF